VLPSLVAPLLAGTITDQLGWRWVFWLMLPLVPVVALITQRQMRAHPPAGVSAVRRSRIAAAIFAAGGLGLFVTALQFRTPVPAVAGAVAGLAVGLPSLRRLFPAGVHRAAAGLAAVVACRMLAASAFLGADSFIPLAADRIHGASPTIQGFTIIGAALAWSTGQWVVAHRPELDPRRTVRWGFVAIAVGVVFALPTLSADWPLWGTFLGWSVGGLGMGMLFNPTSVTAMSHARDGAEGLVSSQVNLADAVGFSTMGGVGGAMVALSEHTQLSLAGAIGINFGFTFVLALLGAACARRIA
jgi:MFS family permease